MTGFSVQDAEYGVRDSRRIPPERSTRIRNPKRRTLSALARAAVAGMLLLSSAASAQQVIPPKIVSVRVGLGDRYKVGLWTQVEVTLQGGSQTLAGEVSVIVPDGDGVPRRFSRLSDVWLRDVRLLSADLTETSWVDATFLGCAAAGVQAFDSGLQRVVFHECKLDSVNFRGAMLTDVTFENCLLRDVDFAGARLKRTRFPGSALIRADFSRATLEKVDLRGAELDITAGFESLRGAIMTTAQFLVLGPALARQLGVELKDT